MKGRKVIIGIVSISIIIGVIFYQYIIYGFEKDIQYEKKDICAIESIEYLANLSMIMHDAEKQGIKINKDFKETVSKYARTIIDYTKKRKNIDYFQSCYGYANLTMICGYFCFDEKIKYMKELENYYDKNSKTYIIEEDSTNEDNIEDTCIILKQCERVNGIVEIKNKIKNLQEFYNENINSNAEATLNAYFLDKKKLKSKYYKRVEKFESEIYSEEIETCLKGKNKGKTFSYLDNTVVECAKLFDWDECLKNYNDDIYLNLKSDKDFEIDIHSILMCVYLRCSQDELQGGLVKNKYYVSHINSWLKENYDYLYMSYFAQMYE